jgi:hypothetical protein
MEVQFYYNQSDARVINKRLVDTGGGTFEGVPRDDVSVMNPIIRFENDSILRFNYAYIPQFQRYYSIVDRTAFREGVWDVTFAVDVLMSFRRDIMNLSVVVDKQSMAVNGNEYIDDGSLVSENVMFQTLYEFPNGFNDTGEYILITAG